MGRPAEPTKITLLRMARGGHDWRYFTVTAGRQSAQGYIGVVAPLRAGGTPPLRRLRRDEAMS